MGPWVHGSMGPWVHGSMGPWVHGSMHQWSCGSCGNVIFWRHKPHPSKPPSCHPPKIPSGYELLLSERMGGFFCIAAATLVGCFRLPTPIPTYSASSQHPTNILPVAAGEWGSIIVH